MQNISHRTAAWCSVAVPALVIVSSGCVASARPGEAIFDRSGSYVGTFTGSALTDNRLTDIDGFANWGNPGWVTKYDDTGFVGGALTGKKFRMGAVPLRVELDATFGGMRAETDQLDPEGLDETARSHSPWIATVRPGIEQTIGSRATVFATGGFAVARIVNSVIDIDSGLNIPDRIDYDDGYRYGFTNLGWVIGGGVEASLTDAWTLRFEGSRLGFGRSIYFVNRSSNNRCGPGQDRRPCPYEVDNRLGLWRLAVIRQFGG